MGPATRFARAAHRWDSDDWWRLEALAWENRPDARRAIAFFSPPSAWKLIASDSASLRSARGCFIALLSITGLAAPLLALIAGLSWLVSRSNEQSFPFVMVGALALVGAVFSGGELLASVHGRIFVDPRTARIYALLHLVPSAILLCLAIPFAAPHLPLALLALAAVPLDLAIGALMLVLHPIPAPARAERWQAQERRLETALAALPDDERGRIARDLGYAFDALERQELAAPSQLAAAREAPLGALGRTLAPRAED